MIDLRVFLLLVYLSSCFAEKYEEKGYRDRKGYDDRDDYRDDRDDYRDDKYYRDRENNENNNLNTNGPFLAEQPNNGRIYRPCPNLHLNCIRKFFEKHSKYCKVTKGRVPEPVYVPEGNVYLSFFNLTVTEYGVEIFGLDGRIKEFYVNEETDLVVLQVEFKRVKKITKLDIFRYSRPGRFPAITKSNSRVQYPTFKTTTIFRGIDKMDLSKSYTTGFLDGAPVDFVDPNAGVNTDPLVARVFAQYRSMPGVVAQESFLTLAPFYAATYIQCTICNYGLKLSF